MGSAWNLGAHRVARCCGDPSGGDFFGSGGDGAPGVLMWGCALQRRRRQRLRPLQSSVTSCKGGAGPHMQIRP